MAENKNPCLQNGALGNNLAERKVGSAWPEKANRRNSLNATISMPTEFLVGTAVMTALLSAKNLYKYFRAFLVIWMGFARPAVLSAQVVGATVSGTVVDTSGGATPGVTVAIRNVAAGITANAVTNGEGFYVAPNLPAGEYQITASHKAKMLMVD
jgi:Carboxypeptidase regulatory-like domain